MGRNLLVALITTGQEILKLEIMSKQIYQVAQRSEGALSYPKTITCLCIEAGHTYIQGIDKCMQYRPLISMTHSREEYNLKEEKG